MGRWACCCPRRADGRILDAAKCPVVHHWSTGLSRPGASQSLFPPRATPPHRQRRVRCPVTRPRCGATVVIRCTGASRGVPVKTTPFQCRLETKRPRRSCNQSIYKSIDLLLYGRSETISDRLFSRSEQRVM